MSRGCTFMSNPGWIWEKKVKTRSHGTPTVVHNDAAGYGMAHSQAARGGKLCPAPCRVPGGAVRVQNAWVWFPLEGTEQDPGGPDQQPCGCDAS